MDRSQEIIRTSWVGIIANVLLAGFKAAVGRLPKQECRRVDQLGRHQEERFGLVDFLSIYKRWSRL